MKKIGLTGGIGSGKSFVAKQIEAMGFPVYYSDDQAKKVSDKNPFVREELISLLGPLVYQNNSLNREYLRKQLFSNDELRQKVNAIIHPIVRADFSNWAKKHENIDLVFNEAAILFETHAYKNFDAVILVYAPEELKIERLMKRDHSTLAEIKAKIKSQWSDAKKKTLTRHHILNDGKTSIENQLNSILQRLL